MFSCQSRLSRDASSSEPVDGCFPPSDFRLHSLINVSVAASVGCMAIHLGSLEIPRMTPSLTLTRLGPRYGVGIMDPQAETQ